MLFLKKKLEKIIRPRKHHDINNKTNEELCSEQLLQSLTDTERLIGRYYSEITSTDDLTDYKEDVEQRISSYRRACNNIIKAYKQTAGISDELSARYRDLMRGKKKHLIFPRAPANCSIDLAESRIGFFAKGINAYKLFLICFVGSFVGVIIETLWCFLKNGYIESRAGLVIGPFNLLYGVGAVALTLFLYRFRNNGRWVSFLGGMLVGSAVEYMCSFFQEMIFGSRSWDYSAKPFNVNGRICLLYSVLWGVLSVLWVKSLYPRISLLILKIPDKYGRYISCGLVVFLTLNSMITLIAVYRWSQRIDGILAENALYDIIDRIFSDRVMERIFANMTFD